MVTRRAWFGFLAALLPARAIEMQQARHGQITFVPLPILTGEKPSPEHGGELRIGDAGDRFYGGIIVHGKTGATRAIVEVFYWADMPSLDGPIRLMLSTKDVVTLVPGVIIGFDCKPVKAKDVAYIDVTLVRDVSPVERFGQTP